MHGGVDIPGEDRRLKGKIQAVGLGDGYVVLTGGGALIGGLDDYLREETGLPVTIAEDPLSCVALGTGRAMEDPIYRGVLMTA